jgi:5'-nucleotidase
VRIVVTNDDGVHAAGIAALARAFVDDGHDVLVVAPLDETSGAGAGVGPIHNMRKGIHVDKVDVPELEGIETLGIDALPALAVIAACMGAFGPPPDLVVAGVNAGRNVGRAVLHSGTVGAALTAAHFGNRGLAVSIQLTGAANPVHYETATAIAVRLAPLVAAAPPRMVLNCNVPNLPLAELRGLRLAHLARSGLIRSVLADSDAEVPRLQLELGLADPPAEDGSDEALTTAGYATLTPLLGVSEDRSPDVVEVAEELVRVWEAQAGAA